jgi:hypothetical protein
MLMSTRFSRSIVGAGFAILAPALLADTHGGSNDLGAPLAGRCPAPVGATAPHLQIAGIRGASIAALGAWRVAPAVEVFANVGVPGSDAGIERAGHERTLAYRF